MKRLNTMAWLAAILVAALLACPVVQGATPKVVMSTVEDGQDDVDPGLSEIRVQFDQAMDPGSWSVVGGGDLFPKITARPRWEDEKTLVIAVRLEPDHEYRMSLNSDTFRGF